MPEQQQKKTVQAKDSILYRVDFWGGLSVLASLISLGLPWWGIKVTPSYFWGVFSGPTQLMPVSFFPDRLDQAFSTNYGFVTSLVAATTALALLGSLLKRWPVLTAAVISSIVTDLFFIGDVVDAVGINCDRTTLPSGESCISGLVGQGSSGGAYVTWGFESGFYLFIASGGLILASLALLQWNKSRGVFHPPSANIEFHPGRV